VIYKKELAGGQNDLGAFFLSDIVSLLIFFLAAPIAAAAVSVAYNRLL